MADGVSIRAMEPADFAEADRVFRLAFGTFFQLADPIQFRGDGSLLPRWQAYPGGGVVAVHEGRIIGLSFVSDLGSFAMLGPVAVLPEFWRHGIGAAAHGRDGGDHRALETAAGRSFHLPAERAAYPALSGIRLLAAPSDARDGAAGDGRRRGSGRHPARRQPRPGCPAGSPVRGAGRRDISGPRSQPRDGRRVGRAIGRRDCAGRGLIGCGLRHLPHRRRKRGRLGRVLHQIRVCALGRHRVRADGAAPPGLREFCRRARRADPDRGRLDRAALCLSAVGRDGVPAPSLPGLQMHRPWLEAYDRPDVFVLDDWR